MKKLLLLIMVLLSLPMLTPGTNACESRPAPSKKIAAINKSPLLARLAQQAVDVSVSRSSFQPEFILGSPLFRF